MIRSTNLSSYSAKKPSFYASCIWSMRVAKSLPWMSFLLWLTYSTRYLFTIRCRSAISFSLTTPDRYMFWNDCSTEMTYLNRNRCISLSTVFISSGIMFLITWTWSLSKKPIPCSNPYTRWSRCCDRSECICINLMSLRRVRYTSMSLLLCYRVYNRPKKCKQIEIS